MSAASLPDPASVQTRERFFSLVQTHLDQGTLVKVILANYKGEESDLQRIQARPVSLKDQPCLSFVYRHATRDITRNLPLAEGLATLKALTGTDFRNAHLLTPTEEIQLAFSKKGKATLRTGKGEHQPEAPQQAHNREKHRFLELNRPFLTALGITDRQHQLIPAMSRKWKQINKFIEIVDKALQGSRLAQQPDIHVVDFGSGKGYLTFAMHDYLRHTLGKQARVTGVELRQELVDLCNQAARELHHDGLQFDCGDVRDYQAGTINVMIALHACDIATDYAIHTGIRTGADIIICSPCCHKQIRPQLLSPHPLRPILQHGVHLGQEAEMLTDGLRALLLDACGYDTQVFEFISLEHTNKNKMILAVKRKQTDPAHTQEVLGQIHDIKDFYRIQEQCLEQLLQEDGLLTAPAN
ncbi:SAM-dependent methyltransferase [Aquabacterium sp.]|uniref:class I SAM-dependent methyltransferase n=1 Tax=Aquabacterium sp. TaxID=1872578 RepID=UPI0035AF9E86